MPRSPVDSTKPFQRKHLNQYDEQKIKTGVLTCAAKTSSSEYNPNRFFAGGSSSMSSKELNEVSGDDARESGIDTLPDNFRWAMIKVAACTHIG